MKREFKYTQKETYTQAEMDDILAQNTKFVEGSFKEYVSPEDHKKVTDELMPFKAEKRNAHVSGLVKDLTDSDEKIRDAIALANISDDDDDSTIKTKVEEVIKNREYLQAKKADIPKEIIKTKKGNKVEVETENDDDKVKNL